jgi:ParB family transcriptional regulator, chromosome partitioning protein
MTDTIPDLGTDGATAAAARDRRRVPLADLGLAPENVRFGDEPDDAVPELAATLRAAGQLEALTVRPGRRKEKSWMVLNGRRRLYAFGHLRDTGLIGDDFAVDVVVETDAARQAAAAVLTNQSLPVHVADVVVAIGRSLKAKLSVEAIARALGYAPLEVRRLAALSGLHVDALAALKAGKLTLKQARLLARLSDRATQGEIARQATAGYGVAEWRIAEMLDEGRTTVRDRRFALVGAARYTAAGGRTESDLFGERPNSLLDPEILLALWSERAERLAADLARDGLTVRVSVDSRPEPPDGLDELGWRYGLDLDETAQSAWRDAQAEANAAGEALAGLDVSDDAAETALGAWLVARIAAAQASEPGRNATCIVVVPGDRAPLDVRVYAPPFVQDQEANGPAAANAPPNPSAQTSIPVTPVAVAPAAEVEGVNHALHEVRTDTATRALIRAIADDPSTALVALIARLFDVLVLSRGLAKGSGALTVGAAAYGRPRAPVIEALDGEVRARLAKRRAVWERSEQSVIGWIEGLPHGEKMATLAELVALSLDLREERTTALRAGARAEAAELAALCGADVTLYWTPDEPFLRAHSKPQLIAMLETMGAEDDRARTLKKDELVAFVAEQAAARGWAPGNLSWSATTEAEFLSNEHKAEPRAPDSSAAHLELLSA